MKTTKVSTQQVNCSENKKTKPITIRDVDVKTWGLIRMAALEAGLNAGEFLGVMLEAYYAKIRNRK